MTNGSIIEAAKDFSVGNKAFLENFSKKEEPQNGIREGTNASLDAHDLLVSFNRLDTRYTRAWFNDEANFGSGGSP